MFGKNISELRMGLEDVYNSVERFVGLGDSFAPIDKELRQLSVQIGGTRAQADKLIDTVIQMGINTGFSVTGMSQLATSLGAVGQSLDGLSEDRRITLAHLADTFGLGADEAVRFSSAATRIGVDLKQLAGEAIVFGDKFRIPNMMAIMPEVTRMAAESISKFSRNVIGNQRELIETTLKTSAIYAKAFGKDIREAASIAEQTIMGFAGAAQQNSDLMLGLADSISPLSMALLQGGASWEQMTDIIDQGQKSPIEAATNMRNMIDSMQPGPYQDRFKRLLQKELPEGIRQLVFEQNAYNEAVRSNAISQSVMNEAVKSGNTAFDDMSKAMRDNFSTNASRV